MDNMNTIIEIPDRLNDVVDGALKEVNKIHRRRIAKRVATSLGSFVVLIGAFFVVCFANPVWASQLPLIGGLFKNFNSTSKMLPGGTHIEEYNVVQPIYKLASTDSKEYSLTVTEGYSDGYRIHLGLDIAVPDGFEKRYDSIDTEYYPVMEVKESKVSVNGETAKIVVINPFQLTDGKWLSTMTVEVPKTQKSADNLELELDLTGFSGRVKEKISGKVMEQEKITGHFTVRLQIKVDRENEIIFEGYAESGGAKVFAVSATPAQTVISVDKPFWGMLLENESEDDPMNHPQGFPHLYIEDGKEITQDARASAELGGYDYNSKEQQTADLYFDGLPAGTKKIILRFEYGDSSDDVLADFTIDLKNRTVRSGSKLNKDDSLFYQNLQGSNMLPDSIVGYVVANISFSRRIEQDGEAHIILHTPINEGGENLKIEVVSASGETLASTCSVLSDGSWNDREWWDFNGPIDTNMHHQDASYTITVPASRLPEKGETLTVTVSDVDSGGILYRCSMKLDVVD